MTFRLYAKYYQKMDGYSQKVSDIEKSHELYQQVAVLQENISKTTGKSKLTSMQTFKSQVVQYNRIDSHDGEW